MKNKAQKLVLCLDVAIKDGYTVSDENQFYTFCRYCSLMPFQFHVLLVT